MNIIVLDTSVNARLLWPDSRSPDGNWYALDVLSQAANGSVFHVPTIWHYEIAHVVARLVRIGQVSQASAAGYLKEIALLPIVTDVTSHAKATEAAFALSMQFGLSACDAAYLELVLRLGGTLATND